MQTLRTDNENTLYKHKQFKMDRKCIQVAIGPLCTMGLKMNLE